MARRRDRTTTRTGGRAATSGVIPGRFALSVGMPDRPTPDGWSWTPLSEVARLETGHTPSRKHPEYWGGDIPWIGIRDATGNHGRTISKTQETTNQQGIANSSARVLPAGTVCLSRTASVGYVVVMGQPMATSQDFVNWVCSDQIDNRYLKYVLLAEHDSMLRFASGTTHQTIYFPEVKAFHVCLPPLQEQRAIAHVLSALDDKIELIRRMNETLEAIARAMFKSWFVDFDPVRAKAEGRLPAGRQAIPGLPKEIADLFPDRFEDSELGEIPVGWQIRGLDEIARFLNGLALQKYPPKDGRSLPVIKIAQLRAGNTDGADQATADLEPEYIVEDGDVLFSWSGSLECVLWAAGRGALNQHLFKVTSAEFPKWFYYLWIHRHLDDFRRIAAGKATTMGHIQRHHLIEAKVVVPDSKALEKMESVVAPLLDQVIQQCVQSRTLAALRDTLLPKLISGELRIKKAERIVEVAT